MCYSILFFFIFCSSQLKIETELVKRAWRYEMIHLGKIVSHPEKVPEAGWNYLFLDARNTVLFRCEEYSASRQIARSFAPLAIALVVGRVRHSLLIPRHAGKTCDY